MEAYILPKDNISQFLRALEAYDVFAPVREKDVTVFERVTPGDEVALDLQAQPQTPKRVILPQTETLFRFDPKKGAVPALEEKAKERVVFGIRPCDARGFQILDFVYCRDFADPYYQTKRDATIFIGLACSQPFANCFCTSVGGGPADTAGLDALLTDVGDGYLLQPLTPKGEGIVKQASAALTAPAAQQKEAAANSAAAAAAAVPRSLGVDGLPAAIEKHFEAPQWRDMAFKCVACGICTYNCPTCHCFDIQDENKKGQSRRVRIWDSCMFGEYTLHASGHNPRPTRAERLRNRLYHKFKATIENFGTPGCVGCGRCITLCPVNEDLIENLEAVRSL